ncbi:MAG: hypothetical protein ACO1OB_33605 [Archangium sp.]
MTSPLTSTFVPASAVASLSESDVLRGDLDEIDGAPEKRAFVLHRVQNDLFAVMRAGGLGEAVDEFERTHTRLPDSDLFVRSMKADDVVFLRDWLVP